MHESANVFPQPVDAGLRTKGQERRRPSRVTHTTSFGAPERVAPDYGCVEWYIYDEQRLRRDKP